jgi:hypothetical protein
LYLASKVEESVIAAKVLLPTMKRLRPAWQYDLKDLMDMEMVRGQWQPGTALLFDPAVHSVTAIFDAQDGTCRTRLAPQCSSNCASAARSVRQGARGHRPTGAASGALFGLCCRSSWSSLTLTWWCSALTCP